MRVLSIGLALMMLFAVSGHAEMRVSIDATEVVVIGATPGGAVLLTGAVQYPRMSHVESGRYTELLADEDSDGVVRLMLPKPHPPRGVWLAVDYSTGAIAKASSEGFVSETITRKELRGRHTQISGPAAEALLIRRNVGVWSVSGVDGSRADADGQSNQSVVLRMEDARTLVGDRIAPTFPSAGDIIIGFDIETLATFEIEVSR